MSIESALTSVVLSYIKAVHAWEVTTASQYGMDQNTSGQNLPSASDLRDRMSAMMDSGDQDALQQQHQNILTEFCTPRDHQGGFSVSSDPEHHPDLELITKVELADETHGLVWTHYQPENSYPRIRRYHLELRSGTWLIDQHYLINDDFDDFPEL